MGNCVFSEVLCCRHVGVILVCSLNDFEHIQNRLSLSMIFIDTGTSR